MKDRLNIANIVNRVNIETNRYAPAAEYIMIKEATKIKLGVWNTASCVEIQILPYNARLNKTIFGKFQWNLKQFYFTCFMVCHFFDMFRPTSMGLQVFQQYSINYIGVWSTLGYHITRELGYATGRVRDINHTTLDELYECWFRSFSIL